MRLPAALASALATWSIGFLGLLSSPLGADPLTELVKDWEAKAFICTTPTGVSFPSRLTDDAGQPCDDGDFTLFNGLLCASGVDLGCIGVAEAQDSTTGQWFRSPRIREQGNDRGGSDFSPDMALGVELYLIKTKDVSRAEKWLTWLNSHTPCALGLFDRCLLQGLPRFCTDDVKEKGCTIRPGDAAQLSATVTYLQQNAGLGELPHGRLRGYLSTFSGYGPFIVSLDSRLNRAGYSQHLVGVSIFLMQSMGQQDSRIADGAARLVDKNPGNAFFRYLKEGKTEAVKAEIIARCPNQNTVLLPPLHQWQWERENADRAWEHSCYWDCIFAAKVVQ
jgi:hypothetical protein